MPSEGGGPLTSTKADDEKRAGERPTLIETPVGVAHVFLELPRATVRALLVLGHGAGGDVDAPDLIALRDVALDANIAVARVRQPYRVAGRRAPAPPRHLDAAWLAVVDELRAASGPFTAFARRLRDRPLVFSGRSSGARVACRTASAGGAAAVVALAFPLHPPGRPERTRADELETGVPLLVVQGSRDAFGTPAQFPAGLDIIEVEGSDHGLKSKAFAAAAADAVRWLTDVVPAR